MLCLSPIMSRGICELPPAVTAGAGPKIRSGLGQGGDSGWWEPVGWRAREKKRKRDEEALLAALAALEDDE